MKKKLGMIFLIFLIFLTACTKSEKDNKVAEQYDFNNIEALKVAEKAMLLIAKRNINELKAISDERAVNGLDQFGNSEFVITGYEIAETSQKGNKALYKFYVTKAVPFKAKASIEAYYIRIDKDKKDNSYKIGKVSSTDILSGVEYNDQIRVRTESDVNMDTLIKLSEVPTETYTKRMKEDISKITVPKDEFAALGFSFDTRNALIATKAGGKYYIASVSFEEAQTTANTDSAEAPPSNNKSSSGSISVKEKSIGKSLTSIDVYNDAKVEYLIFSDNNKYIIVSTENKYGVKRFHLYKAKGDDIELKLDEKFDEEKYSILYFDCSNGKLIFDVKAADGKDGTNPDVFGRYCLTLKDMKLSKM